MDPVDELDLFNGPVAVVILAAGTGSRYDDTEIKQLLEYEGKPLLQHAVDASAAAGADEILVVIGHEEDAVRDAVNLPDTAIYVLNLDHAEGVSISLTAGLLAASPAVEAAVIMLADQPGVEPAVVTNLIETYRDTRMPIVRAQYRDSAGPILIAATLWDDVIAEAALAKEAGARAFVDANEDLVEIIEIDAPGPIDVDTPEDYERLKRA